MKIKCKDRDVHRVEHVAVCGRCPFPRTAVAVQRVSVQRPTVWRCVTWRCEAACKTHRNRYGSQAATHMEGQTGLSHCVWAECLCVRLCRVEANICVHNSVFLETTWYEAARPLALTEAYQWLGASAKLPLTTAIHTHTNTFDIKTHRFSAFTSHNLEHHIWYQFLTLSIHCPNPEVIINQWWIHL